MMDNKLIAKNYEQNKAFIAIESQKLNKIHSAT